MPVRLENVRHEIKSLTTQSCSANEGDPFISCGRFGEVAEGAFFQALQRKPGYSRIGYAWYSSANRIIFSESLDWALE